VPLFEGTFDLVADILEFRPGMSSFAFGFQAVVAGGISGWMPAFSANFIRGVPDFVAPTHGVLPAAGTRPRPDAGRSQFHFNSLKPGQQDDFLAGPVAVTGTIFFWV
jgi:hypothetical protein